MPRLAKSRESRIVLPIGRAMGSTQRGACPRVYPEKLKMPYYCPLVKLSVIHRGLSRRLPREIRIVLPIGSAIGSTQMRLMRGCPENTVNTLGQLLGSTPEAARV